MKCPKCGNECDENVKFCPNCAYPISVYMEGLKSSQSFHETQNTDINTVKDTVPKQTGGSYSSRNNSYDEEGTSSKVAFVLCCIPFLCAYGLIIAIIILLRHKDRANKKAKSAIKIGIVMFLISIFLSQFINTKNVKIDPSTMEVSVTKDEAQEESSIVSENTTSAEDDGADVEITDKEEVEDEADDSDLANEDDEIDKEHQIIDKPSDDEIVNVDRMELHQNVHKYEDKWVRIAGKIVTINGEEGEYTIEFYGASSIKLIFCELMSDQVVDGLDKDDYATVVGKVENKLIGQVMVYNCYIEDTGESSRAFNDEMLAQSGREDTADEDTDDDSEEDKSSTSLFGTDEIDKSTAIQVTAKGVYQEMQDNQVACKNKYDGKVVAISGTIEDIGTNIYGQEYITFDVGDPYSLDGVQCFFKNDQMDYLSTLSKGQSITLYGYADVGSMTFKLGHSQP